MRRITFTFVILQTIVANLAIAQAPAPEKAPAAPLESKLVEHTDNQKELLTIQQSVSRQLKETEGKYDQRLLRLETQNKELRERLDDLEIQQAEQAEQDEQQRKILQLYGWIATSFFATTGLSDPENNLHGYIADQATFSITDISLIVDAQPADKWRALFETRFTFSPDGRVLDYEVPGLIPFNRETTVAKDGSMGGLGEYRWGGVVVDRVWLEWAPRDYFKILAGQFFTPAGIWNLDHGAPVLIGFMPPMMLSTQYIPLRQTGLMLHGSFFFAQERVEYALTFSNGRVPIANTDLDNNKAFGGRVVLATSRLVELKLGFSWYIGQYTDSKDVINAQENVQPPILPRLETAIVTQFNEMAIGADLQLDYKSFGLRSELLYNIIKYNDPYRTSLSPSSAFAFAYGISDLPMADHAIFGLYGQLFYQLPWLNLRPYASAELINPNDNISWDLGVAIGAGLNYRPHPRIALKLEYMHVFFPNNPQYTINTDYLNNIERRLAVISGQAVASF